MASAFLLAAGIEPGQQQALLWFAGALALLIFLTWRMRSRTRGKMGPPDQTARQRLDELAAQRGVKGDMEELLAELQDLSRKINAQIDTKFAKLEAVIADADRRIEVLERLSGSSGEQPRLDITVGDDIAGGPPPSPAAGPRAMAATARVYELADSGMTPVQIAQALGRTPGEIELILGLRPRA
ncbi:MAG: hypothetical protein JXA69_00035 [Phycisphaerae bacterium]|nr:hypothetical protein [Phycisphaerae bacterium]